MVCDIYSSTYGVTNRFRDFSFRKNFRSQNKNENNNLQLYNENKLNLKIGELVIKKSNLINKTNENKLKIEYGKKF